MQIDRNNFAKEMKLRKLIREAISVVNKRKEHHLNEEVRKEGELRNIVRLLVETEVGDKVPHQSTGINVLEDLLKKIIPILQDGFYQLTTSQEQRDSFRAHIVKGTQNLLAPTRVADALRTKDDAATGGAAELGEQDEISMDVENDDTPEGFIDIDPPDEEELSPDEKKKQEFAIGGMDTTGRNVALDVFKRVETAIVDAYDLLDNDEDEEVFYDYLLTNLKLYMDKFEDDLKGSIDEPTTPEYEQEKDADDVPAPPGDDLLEFNYNKLLKIAEQ